MSIRHRNLESEEMAQWLRVLAVLAENQGSVLSTHIRQLTTICNSSTRDLTLPSGLRDYCIHVHKLLHIDMHTYM